MLAIQVAIAGGESRVGENAVGERDLGSGPICSAESSVGM
jgi:hypothetical protein